MDSPNKNRPAFEKFTREELLQTMHSYWSRLEEREKIVDEIRRTLDDGVDDPHMKALFDTVDEFKILKVIQPDYLCMLFVY